MALSIFNVARGAWGYYSQLPAANDAIVLIPMEESGLEAVGTLQDYDTVAAILAGASNEQTTIGRKTATGVASVVNDTDNVRTFTFDPAIWTGASGNDLGGLLVAYDPDTTSSDDSDRIPLFFDDVFSGTASGDLTYTPHEDGIAEG